MTSLDLLKHSSSFISFAASIRCIPFKSNEKCELTHLKGSQLIVWHFNSFYIILYTIYLWIDLIFNLQCYIEKMDFVALIIHLCWSTGWGSLFCIKIDHLLNRMEIACAVNQLVMLVEVSKGK